MAKKYSGDNLSLTLCRQHRVNYALGFSKTFNEIQKSKINSSPKNFEVTDRDVQTELRNEKFKNAKMIGKIRISRSPIEQKDEFDPEKGFPPAYSSPDSNSNFKV